MAKEKPYYTLEYLRKDSKGNRVPEVELFKTDAVTGLRDARRQALVRMWSIFLASDFRATCYRIEPDGTKSVEKTIEQLASE